MTLFQFRDDSGKPLDTHYEIPSRGVLILHSRGNKIGTSGDRNTEYGTALRILIDRINQSILVLDGVWTDSKLVQDVALEDRRIYSDRDARLTTQELFTALLKRMETVDRDSEDQKSRGNSERRLRFEFAGKPHEVRMIRILGWGRIYNPSDIKERIPSEELRRVTSYHIWRAVDVLVQGSVEHPFRESTHYDVIAETGEYLPPKAVFGLAASEALGFNLLPEHFAAGKRTLCFDEICRAGYKIVPKDGPALIKRLVRAASDRTWVEGHRRLVTHHLQERAAGLAAVKKAAFREVHGRLFCERCGLDPREAYEAEYGDACIEVHHSTPLRDWDSQRKTRLNDLICVCANCHRVIHCELRRARNRASSTTN